MRKQVDLEKLHSPFQATSVKWRVGSTNADKSKGLALAYIDARNVMDRLDKVVGSERWQNEFSLLEDDTRVICRIGIKCQCEDGSLEWVWKSDGAGATDIEGEKGGISDSFKRAAVHWGIGRYLYELPGPWVKLVARGRSYGIAPGEMDRLQAILESGSDPGLSSKAALAGLSAPQETSPPAAASQASPPSEWQDEDSNQAETWDSDDRYGGGDDTPVTKERLKDLKIWPRLFKLNERKHGKDGNKFAVADEILSHIEVGKMSNLKEKHIEKLLTAISNYENTGGPNG